MKPGSLIHVLDAGEIQYDWGTPIPDDIKWGTTTLIMGPMFSGKTSRGFNAVRSAILGNKQAVVINHNTDIRYTQRELATSHDGISMKAISVASLVNDPPGLPGNVDLVFVDEGHFFSGLAAFCMRQNKLGRDVIVSALNSHGDAERTPWPHVMELIPLAHRIHMLNSICTICHGVANCSRYIAGSLSGTGIDVGANDKYIATCAQCYTVEIPPGALANRAERVAYVKSLSK